MKSFSQDENANQEELNCPDTESFKFLYYILYIPNFRTPSMSCVILVFFFFFYFEKFRADWQPEFLVVVPTPAFCAIMV